MDDSCRYYVIFITRGGSECIFREGKYVDAEEFENLSDVVEYVLETFEEFLDGIKMINNDDDLKSAISIVNENIHKNNYLIIIKGKLFSKDFAYLNC